MLSLLVLFLLNLIGLSLAASCGTIKYNGTCSFGDGGYVYIRGSVAPATSGTGNDLLSFSITSAAAGTTAVTPVFGFDCLPTTAVSTAIDSRDFDPKSATCSANSPLGVGIPLRSGLSYSAPGNWIIGLKACSTTACAFDLSAQLLQGACGQTPTDWQIMTADQVKALKLCSSGSNSNSGSAAALSPLPALLAALLAFASFSTVNAA